MPVSLSSCRRSPQVFTWFICIFLVAYPYGNRRVSIVSVV